MSARVIFTTSEAWEAIQFSGAAEKLKQHTDVIVSKNPKDLNSLMDESSDLPTILVLDCEKVTPSGRNLIQQCQALRSLGHPIGLIGSLKGEILKPKLDSSALSQLHIDFDDVILTPVRENELAYRVDSVLRKITRPDRRKTDRLCLGPLQFDLKMMSASANKHQLRLTRKETELLLYLAYRVERVVERESLVRDLWNGTEYSDSIESVLNGHLSRIREKLGRAGCRGILKTVRGLGVSLTLSDYEQHWSEQESLSS
jgi:DNA-binding response OmpR family regulator